LNFLQSALPADTEIKVCYKHPQLKYPGSNLLMELDVYVPSMSLALEYQGVQHYYKHYLWRFEEQVMRDKEKREACKNAEIHLIEIPYWWDKSSSSLMATLKERCPHLPINGSNDGIPIPTDNPTNFTYNSISRRQ
jgi:allophanate hydrolase subunit 1